jgi:hypothetical protein
LPLPILLVYARWSTLIISISFLVFFRYVEQKGLTFPAAMRNFRAWIVGQERPGWPGVLHRKFRDFG